MAAARKVILLDVVEQFNSNRHKLINAHGDFISSVDKLKKSVVNSPEEKIIKKIDTDSIIVDLEKLGIYKNYKPLSTNEEYLAARDQITKQLEQHEIQNDCLVENILSSCGMQQHSGVQIVNPRILVVGQSKAGKSTLINTMLQRKVVAQQQTICTARETHLFYCEETVVAEMLDGKLKKFRHLTKNKSIPPKYLGAKDSGSARSDTSKTKIKVKAGYKCEFLKEGIDIIDSPGLNENNELNQVVESLSESSLPVVIYVIDGAYGLSQHDITDINRMKDSSPAGLQFIYFVTHLDSNKYDRRDDPYLDEHKQAIDKLKKVFDKLKANGLLHSLDTMENSIDFHGASLTNVQKWRDGDISNLSDIDRFNRFEMCLRELLQTYLESNILNAAGSLTNLVESTLENVINQASFLASDKNEKLKNISTIQNEEEAFYLTMKKRLTLSRNEFSDRLAKWLVDQKSNILNQIENIKLEDHGIQIPADGIIQDRKILKECRTVVKTLLCSIINSKICSFIKTEVMAQLDEIEEQMLEQIWHFANGRHWKTSFVNMLENFLLRSYKMYPGYGKRNKQLRYQQSASGLRSKIHHLLNISKIEPINVKDSRWKRNQGAILFDAVNKHDLAKDVSSSFLNNLEGYHDVFLKQIDIQKIMVNDAVKSVDHMRQIIASRSSEIAVVYMACQDILDSYKLKDWTRNELIGTGGFGSVYNAMVNETRIAIKEIIFARQIDPERTKQSTAMEFYYSKILKHPRLLSNYGIQITYRENMENVRIFYDLMSCNLNQYLQSKDTEIVNRIELAIQIAEGVQFLHNQGIVHRDLKLSNVLIKEGNAFLSDFGCCKAIGLLNKTLAGTCEHIAPEMLEGQLDYGAPVDIYSFSIMFWYLLSAGSENPRPQYFNDLKFHPSGNYLPQFTRLVAVENARPHKLPFMNNFGIWELLETCWAKDTNIRPNIDVVIQSLNTIKSYFIE